MNEQADGSWPLPDEAATAALATRLAQVLDDGLVLYLHGPLGAGKTSFARALLTAMEVGERVKSPTYSLIEGYATRDRAAWHLDLYRIADPAELEWLGLDALADPAALVLVEWPERGAGALPAADLELHLDYAGAGRQAAWRAFTGRGERLLARLAKC
ncbi:tRNA (adenosine(37)-N6)-threonylcarbamoyltransferase complex ATPase subunit type 1 TsaE [Rhodanobacter denitrificans]|uniref:tRNA threonylcarbamoyladenosine biosynthesis protein TsaE n=1 Tax=Rhodanobacter denitrificans TaxID=666685 RepID=A0A368KA82_9GAMM|nr:tRNA (adenosine(37)-N6)-threonylcarbamoyltransferase complex ATPase subunit type 1 TsaE [Rhodanobacter denitrificans]RCS28744.1 tRNA (adenosine(37)-N6)-threonylcarbamoyltransferase complex ATPase subunit type 1 TsaE [Rhodanobacter denitrificans]